LKDEKSALIKVDSSSRVQFSDGDYTNDDDLYNKNQIFRINKAFFKIINYCE
jgi:hypothetical protein